MTATDELRRLLDERGVKHIDDNLSTSWLSGGWLWSAYENVADDTLMLSPFFPEQAVEATLGRGECHSDNNPPLLYDDPFRVFRCSECHHKVDLRHNPKPNYCPNCGRKVVDA